MKRLLLVAVLLVASAAPALAEEFANPYHCLVADKCRETDDGGYPLMLIDRLHQTSITRRAE